MSNPFKKKRPSAASRGYDAEWHAARNAFLRKNHWCAFHLEMGERVQAQVVDHIVPHRGDKELFWDKNNWQALCFSCHSSKTATMDGGGYNKRVLTDGVMRGCKPNGEPADPNHHWNKKK